MRVLAFLLLVILIPIVAFGIAYVPRHDGAWLDLALAVLLPTLGSSWCLWQLVQPPKRGTRRPHLPQDAKSSKPASSRI